MIDNLPKPKKKAAVLRMLWPEIQAMLETGYAHHEVIDWLSSNHQTDYNLATFQSALYRERKRLAEKMEMPTQAKQPDTLIKPTIASEPELTIASEADENAPPRLSTRQKRAAFADEIMRQAEINPLLKK